MNSECPNAICVTHIGKRISHEDNYLLNADYLTAEMQQWMKETHAVFCKTSGVLKTGCYAISDGMGGHNAGEVASRMCVEQLAILQRSLQYSENITEAVARVQSAIAQINVSINRISCQRKEFVGMGATLVILIICNGKYAVLNIGDSRAYAFDGYSLKQLTTDHTEGQRLLDLGLLTRKELDSFSARKNLYRYVGYREQGYVLQADVIYPDTDKGVFILCSDGITDSVPDSIISSILLEETDLTLAGKKIINLAIEADNADNSTLILVPIGR